MIPKFNEDGLLPPGIHWATWDEIWNRFGTNKHRQKLLYGFKAALLCLRRSGCRISYLDGSFVTDKDFPNDFDACYETDGFEGKLLLSIDPILLDLTDGRKTQKAKYYGEIFPNVMMSNPEGHTFLDLFQIDRETGRRKGIIGIKMEDLL